MPTPASVQRTYYLLMLGNTLAASFIWGINTIFLLDAGLSNFEAFAANAFFTAGMVLFEVPTGIVADTVGRRASYLLGTVTLTVSTLLYVLLWQIEAPVLGVGRGLDAARPRVHVLLRCGRGLARRRPHRDGVRRRSRDRLRPRPDRERSGDARRVGRRRLHRPGHQPRCALRPSCGGARDHVRRRVRAHARHRVHAKAWGPGDDRDARDRVGVDPVRLAGPGGQVDHGLVDLHRRRRDLRLLRAAAVPARARRRPRRVRDCRAGGRDRRRRPDRRRDRGALDKAHASIAARPRC